MSIGIVPRQRHWNERPSRAADAAQGVLAKSARTPGYPLVAADAADVAHTREHLDKAIEAIVEVGRKFEVVQ